MLQVQPNSDDGVKSDGVTASPGTTGYSDKQNNEADVSIDKAKNGDSVSPCKRLKNEE